MSNPRSQIAMQGQLSMDSFMNTLRGVKDNNLRSVMNASGTTVGLTGKQVIAPMERNPQTIDEIRQEKMDIAIQNVKIQEGWEKTRTKWLNEKILMFGIAGFLLYKFM
jgi:hypothetical protein